MNTLLEVKDLSKNYGSVQALREITFSLEAGKIYGLLGRNGAGKTTLLNLLTSRIYSHRGEINLFGQPGVDNQQALARICYMPEKNLFPEGMRVHKILETAGMFYPDYNQQEADDLCRLFALDTHKRYKNLSRGYESILRIVIGLAAHAELTIFDEPILGLDAAARDLFYQTLVKSAADHPRTFILSTHLIDESADLFEDVLILKDGSLIAFANADDLRRSAFHLTGRSDLLEQLVKDHPLQVLGREGIGNLASLAVRGRLDPAMRTAAMDANIDVAPISLQKLFIYMTESN